MQVSGVLHRFCFKVFEDWNTADMILMELQPCHQRYVSIKKQEKFLNYRTFLTS